MLLFHPALTDELRILALGAHCDDIEIGCGATLVSLAMRWPRAHIALVTLSGGDGRRALEAQSAARLLLERHANVSIRIESLRTSYFPSEFEAAKDLFEGLKKLAPDLVLTHARHDLHQDHRLVNELTWNTFRTSTILEYEIPKFDGDLGTPNVYVPMTRAQLDHKCNVLMTSFASQHDRPWFTPETFKALARLRGIECNAAEGYAEAFYGRKVVLFNA